MIYNLYFLILQQNYGFVHMKDREAAKEAIENLHHYKLHGVCINVEASKGGSKSSTKLHVGNLSSGCTSQELQAKFEEYGTVLECDIVKDYAFVHLERSEDAMEAIRGLDGTEFKGEIPRSGLFKMLCFMVMYQFGAYACTLHCWLNSVQIQCIISVACSFELCSVPLKDCSDLKC